MSKISHTDLDAFDIVFDVFKVSFLEQNANSKSETATNLSLFIQNDIQQSLNLKRDRFKSIKNLIREKSLSKLYDNELFRSAIRSKSEDVLKLSRCQIDLIIRRYQHNIIAAHKRLTDLVTEVFDEFLKSRIRIDRRCNDIQLYGKIGMVHAIHSLCWKKFIGRLCFEIVEVQNYYANLSNLQKSELSNFPKAELLCKRADSFEFSAVSNLLLRNLKVTNFFVSQIVRIDHDNVANILSRGKSESGSEAFKYSFKNFETTLLFASNKEEFRNILRVIKISFLCKAYGDILMDTQSSSLRPSSKFSSRERPTSSSALFSVPGTASLGAQSSLIPSIHSRNALRDFDQYTNPTTILKPLTFLATSPIEWLIPASFYPNFWDRYSSIAYLDANELNDFSYLQRVGNLDYFTYRFVNQHASFISNQRVYFCLEERSLALSGAGSFPSSSSLDDKATKSKTHSVNGDTDLQLLTLLQV